MDRVQGELLIYRVKDHPQIDRQQLLEWIRQLLEQLVCYHRCHNNQNYRYLNPYSVLIARDGKVLLLDLTAESNAFVLRNLQKRAMRAHFVKPVVHITEGAGDRLDLYGYGKTLQFILANTIVEPSFTKRQENKFEKIIHKCLDELPGKQYKELIQIEKDLPIVKEKNIWEDKKTAAAGTFVILSLCSAILSGAFAYHITQEQRNVKEWIWELQQARDDVENEEFTELEEKIAKIEKSLMEEIAAAQDRVEMVNENVEQHLNEIKAQEEEKQKEEEKTEKQSTEKSEQGAKEE